MSRRHAVSVTSPLSGSESRRPHRHARPWQLIVAELALNAGRGGPASEIEARCGCPLCSGPRP